LHTSLNAAGPARTQMILGRNSYCAAACWNNSHPYQIWIAAS